MLADPRALCQRFATPLQHSLDTEERWFYHHKGRTGWNGWNSDSLPDFKLTILAPTQIWSRTSYQSSYKCFKINIPSQPLKLWKMTVKTREWPTLGQQPVVKGLCTVTTIKMEGWKRRYVILTHSINEDGDMFLLFLCALVIRVHEIGL